MGIKKPSDYFKKESKDNENLIGKPNLSSYSEAFNSFKEHLSKFDKISDTIKIVDEIKTELQDFLKKEDLDNAMMSYVFLLEENINTLKDNVKSINTKTLTEIKSKVTDVTEVVNEFAEVELPKYKKNIIDAEVRSDKKFNQFKEEFSKLIDEVSTNIDTKQFEIESKTEENLNEVVTNFENKINDLYSGNDGLSKTIKTKVNEIKKLKKDVIEHFKVNKSINKDLTEKISNLEIEIIRGENNIKEQNDDLSNKISNLENEIIRGENNLKEHNDNLSSIEKNIKEELEKDNFVLSTKIKNLEEVYEKLKEESKKLKEDSEKLKEESKINETLIEQIIPSTKTSDPLTPLDQNYVTLDQLQEHYRLFLNRIQTQLSTLGGGGETRLQYLDDIVGIATDLSEYNGKFLKVDTSQPAGKNFVFETVSGGGGGGSTGAGGTWATFDSNTGITTTKKVKIANDLEVTGVTTIGNVVVGGATTDLLVNGDARVTGILTIGTGSITLNPTEKKISGIDEIEIGSGTTAITIKKSERGEIQFTDESGEEKSVGIGTTVSINTSGIITATKFSGSGEDLTGLTATQIPNLNASKINAGTLGSDRIPDLAASKITSGTFDTARIPTLNQDTSGNAATATALETARNIGGVSFDGTSSINLPGVNQAGNQNTSGTAAGLSGTPDITIRNLVGVAATFTGVLTYEDVTNVDAVGLITAQSGIRVTGGVIEAQAGKNKIPSLYSNLGELPDAGTYHGMFAHVHSTGKGYFSHAGGWYELVNVENNGVVGTGTQRYNLGALVSTSTTATSLNVTGVSTFAGNINANGNIIGDSSTNISGINSVTATTFFGDGSGLTELTTSQIPDLAASKITSGTFDTARIPTLNQNTSGTSGGLSGSPNINVSSIVGTALSISGISSVGTAITMYGSSGIVSATKFCGDGSCLTGISAGFNADDQKNLFSGGTCTGCSATVNAEDNIALGDCAGKSLTNGEKNVLIGQHAGQCIAATGKNVVLGGLAGCQLGKYGYTAEGNTFLGYGVGRNTGGGAHVKANIFIGCYAGKCVTAGCCNTFLGALAGSYAGNITGSNNVAIGRNVCLPSLTGSDQLVIGSGSNNWISGDSSFNTTLAGIATVYSATGIVSATKFCGDGSALTGISAGGFTPDDQQNLYAGTDAGAASDADTCFNIGIGDDALKANCAGDRNFAIGVGAGKAVTSGNYNLFFGFCAGASETTGEENIIIGKKAGECSVGNKCNLFIGNEVARKFCRGQYNIAFGQDALRGGDNGAGTCVCTSIVIGDRTGCRIREGVSAVYIGAGAGKNVCNTAFYNIAIGSQAGFGGNANQIIGSSNVFVGADAGKCITSGGQNAMIGVNAGLKISSGGYNAMFGASAGICNTSGGRNVFIGKHAGQCNTTGSYNVALGCGAGAHWGGTDSYQLSIGIAANNWIVGNSDYNVGIGTTNPNAAVTSGNTKKLSVGILSAYQLYGDGSALTGISAGFSADSRCNLFAGCGSGVTAGVGTDKNIVMGFCSGYNLNGAVGNIFMGCYIGVAACGNYNIAFGRMSGRCLTSGNSNILMGTGSGQSLTTGDRNVLMGSSNFDAQTGADYNIGIGFENATVNDVTGEQNVLIGQQNARRITSGCCNTVIGQCNADCLSTANCNVLIGRKVVATGVFTGHDNVFLGQYVAKTTTSADCNVMLGYHAGKNLTTGSENIALGKCVMSSQTVTGSGNIFMGVYSGKEITSGTYNIGFGKIALGGANLSGDGNLAMGCGSGRNVTSGNNNLFLGKDAGKQISSSSCNLFIGNFAGCSSTAGDHNIVIGNCANVGSLTGSNQLAIGMGANNWIVGNSDFNVGIGTTNPNAAVGVGNTAKLSVGILSAYQLYGDGSALTGISAGGFNQDDQGNLYAGTGAGANSDADTCFNIGIGCCALTNLQGTGDPTGAANVAIGAYAGLCMTNGCRNILIGCFAGKCITSGKTTTAIGHQAARDMRSGEYNAFFGSYAGMSGCSGSKNTAVGSSALKNIGSGGNSQQNTGLGHAAGRCVQNACFNTFVGSCSGSGEVICGDLNTAVGYKAGSKITTGQNNVFLGQYGGSGAALTGQNNIAIGNRSGRCITSGGFNIALGCDAMGTGTITGMHNIAMGVKAGDCLTSGCYNIFFGYHAGTNQNVTGNDNIFLGQKSGCCASSASSNIVIGEKSAEKLTTGDGNIVLGCTAANQGTLTGSLNTIIGAQAGRNIAGGQNNVLLGYKAGCDITSAEQNVFIGAVAGLCHQTGARNIAIGYNTKLPMENTGCQLAISNGDNYWIVGNSDYNVGIGTTNPNAAVDVGNTAKLSVGIVSAYQLYGDGSGLTGITATGVTTISGQLNLNGMSKETINIVANKLSAATDIDLEDGLVHYFSTTETADATPNIRFNSSTTLNSKLSVGDSITVTIISSTNNTNYSYEQLTIDGSAVTEQWIGGAAPSGGSSGYDVYTFQIIKTADATYLVFGNKVNFT